MGRQMQELLSKNNIEYLGIDKDNRKDAENFDADVIVDFSSYLCLLENLKLAYSKKIPIVIATTNHNEENLKSIEKYKQEIPIFLTSNFSFMFYALLKIVKNLAILKDCDFILEETHHKHKKDSPSGSCKEILKILNQFNITPQVSCYRVGETIGNHAIKVFANNESLEISHNVTSREVFCEGALKACQFILNKKSGLYSMTDLLEENVD